MDSRKPLTEREIFELMDLELKATPGEWQAHDLGASVHAPDGNPLCRMLPAMMSTVWDNSVFIAAARNALPRLLSLLTPPPDAAVREAVGFSAEARCSRLARGILRIGKKLRVMRADMASQTDALIAAMYAINDAGILMPDEVLNYVSTERAVQAPRLTPEQVEAVKMAETLLADTMSDYGDCEHDVGHCICKYHSGVFSLRSAFPDLFTGEVGRG